MPPASGLKTTADRIKTFRVSGVSAAFAACSQAVATSMLKDYTNKDISQEHHYGDEHAHA